VPVPFEPTQPEEPAKQLPRWQLAVSISRSLWIMAAIGVVAMLFVVYQQLAEARRTTLAETHRQLARLDMVLAEQTGRALDTSDLVLRAMIDHSLQYPDLKDETRAIGRRRLVGLKQILAVDLVEANGEIRVTTRTDMDVRLPDAALALLARHAAEPDAGMLFSEPIRTADGAWATLMTRRMADRAGKFAGIGIAWINLDYFEDFYGAAQLDNDGTIMLHRRDGTVLARFPHKDAPLGASFAGFPPFHDIVEHSQAGTLELDSLAGHGGKRVLAIHALGRFPLAVAVSVDEASVLAAWRRQSWTFSLETLFGVALAVLLVFKLARRTSEVERLLSDAMAAHGDAEASNRDLTVQMEERQRAEAALRNAQRLEAVGQLTGGVAHDFNNLLTVILGNIDLMQTHPAAAVFTGRLTTMRSAAERGARLVSQLLAFARRQPLMARAVDLCVLINAMRPLLESAVGSQVSITFDLASDVPPAMVDQTQIELVILNLAINARDAMPLGGALRLELRRIEITSGTRLAGREAGPGPGAGPGGPASGVYVRLLVSDTGTGMAPEVLSRAFEPYFTTKAAAAGSGLGLSQVYGVAHQSGGMAQIQSVLGQGTTVEVLLPQAGANDLAPEVQADLHPASIAGAGEANVLVVDDDADVRVTTALLLRRMGYRVTEASSASEALIALELDGSIELLLTDVVMPEISGPELARKTGLLRPDLPIVYFSGYADPGAIVGAIPLARLLRKPFRPAELVTLIETALAEARLTRESAIAGS
jgi:signal transduction histidine kinase/ActR/RegA family two-component response regulator